MMANVRVERLLKIPAEPSPELRIPALQLKREWSPWPEFGSDPGNPRELGWCRPRKHPCRDPGLRPCVIALAVMLVGLPTAQAADTTLTLACEGTTTDKMKDAKDAKPAPISMGIIVNFTKIRSKASASLV
jgi:hypothetical protein